MYRDRCPGPTPEGGCSRLRRDGLVRCAGRQVELTLVDGTKAVWEVSEDATSCFLACLTGGVGFTREGEPVPAARTL